MKWNRKGTESSIPANKIELINCPKGGATCSSQLSDINKNFMESDNYQQNKEYRMSIRSLQNAFDKTYELEVSKCKKCAQLFRSTIINSLENMHVELEKMSSEKFRGKHYRSSYVLAEDAIRDLREKED